MGVFKRMRDMAVASVHDVLDKMEDPEVMLKQYVRDMEEEIARAETAVSRQMAKERMLKQRLEQARRISDTLSAKAEEELRAGREEEARKALEENLRYQAVIGETEAAYAQAKAQAEELAVQLQVMKDEFHKMKEKRNELIQRSKLARVRKQTAAVSAVNVLENGDAARGFHRIEEKIMQLEAEAEIAKAASPAPSMNEAQREQIDAQLEELKQKVQ